MNGHHFNWSPSMCPLIFQYGTVTGKSCARKCAAIINSQNKLCILKLYWDFKFITSLLQEIQCCCEHEIICAHADTHTHTQQKHTHTHTPPLKAETCTHTQTQTMYGYVWLYGQLLK